MQHYHVVVGDRMKRGFGKEDLTKEYNEMKKIFKIFGLLFIGLGCFFTYSWYVLFTSSIYKYYSHDWMDYGIGIVSVGWIVLGVFIILFDFRLNKKIINL